MGSQTLGFYDLMNIAEQNSEKSERDASKLKFPSFKASKNKKEDPKSKALSDSIRKFKAKQEEERRKQEDEARIKRQQLIELRAKDSKSKNRVNRMLKMTKSANKAVVADAIDSFNDSLVDQHDGLQPDDDDYGFVSQSSQEMHKKLLQQYKTIKKSVPIPHQQKVQEVVVPEVKSLKSQSEQPSSASPEKKKSRKPAPPALSYHDLLALANEKKDKQPEIFFPRVVEKKNEEKFEFGRPMTAKEKEEYIAEKSLRDRVAKQVENGTFRLKPPAQPPQPREPKSKEPPKSFKIPRQDSPASLQKSRLKPESNSNSHLERDREHKEGKREAEKRKPKPETTTRPPIPSNSPKKRPEDGERVPKSSSAPLNPYMDHIPVRYSNSSSSSKNQPSIEKEVQKKVKEERRDRSPVGTTPKVLHNQTNQSLPPIQKQRHVIEKSRIQDSRLSSKQEEKRPEPTKFGGKVGPIGKPRETRPGPREPEQRRRPLPPHSRDDERRKPKSAEPVTKKGRQVIESDEEYDSEMDDFIDDSECDPNSISAMIRQITGYDKRKFRLEDEGECMETNAYDQMREENYSLREGIKEDLEDMRLEEEERKKKLKQTQLAKKKSKS